MPNYLWLVWRRALTELSLKPWALVLTYDDHEEAYGTAYQIKDVGTGLSKYAPEIVRGVQFQDHNGRRQLDGRMLLGLVSDAVVELLPLYSEVGVDVINTQNTERGLVVGEATSQDWALQIICSLEDSKILEKGTLEQAKLCPRRG